LPREVAVIIILSDCNTTAEKYRKTRPFRCLKKVTDKPLIRHLPADRLLHWVFAASIVLLLLTGLLPKLGIEFPWLVVHWVTGLVLVAATLVHLLRVLLFKPLRNIWIGPRDFIRGKPGKFSLAQKLMHNGVAVLALTAIVTGLLMLVRIDTPFWERDPYWLAADTWGLVYVLHGLAALCFVSTIMLHIYFSLRPEKRMYLRAIFKGWITRDEYQREHDPERWQP
jgi:formate dehydrogenase subunit gamma